MKTLLRTYKHHLDQRFSNWVVAHKLPELEHMGHENAISKHIITDMASVSLPQIKWGHYMITLTHFNPPSPPTSIRSSRWSISFPELYDYCLKEKIADGNIIAKWKKTGYENLCCLKCIQTNDTAFGANCICRVPKTKLEEVNI